MNVNADFDRLIAHAQRLQVEAEVDRQLAEKLLNAIAVIKPFFGNDNDAVSRPTTTIASTVAKAVNDNTKTVQKSSKGKSKLKDSDMIDALNTNFQSPPEMVDTLAKVGINISKGLIYQRMPALAVSLPDLIEADGNKWRIKSKTVATPAKVKAASKAVVTRPKVRKAPAKKANPYAAAAAAMQSVLTNEWKSVAALVSQARRYGWKGDADLAARALDGLVRSGLADENDNHSFRRA